MTDLDALLSHQRYAPRSGWHDDHRAADGTPAYLPAMMQVRGEFLDFLALCAARGLSGSMLQLGLGECDASHAVWRTQFQHVVTIDWRECLADDERYPGADTRSGEAIRLALNRGPYDLLFVDAGHSLADVRHDHLSYGAMVRPGGIVAFHDAVRRPEYPEVRVPDYVAILPNIAVIGHEVGIAWCSA